MANRSRSDFDKRKNSGDDSDSACDNRSGIANACQSPRLGEDQPMPYATLDDWIANEAIPFAVDSPAKFNAGVDKLVASLDPSVQLLAIGEALHGSEELLILRNRLFQRL